jgi:hypothetical protein
MKIKNLIIISVLAVALLGCDKHEPRHIVVLPDVSGSIDRQSMQEGLKAVDELAKHLHRGDKLTIIPILGDAQAGASGRILRFEVPISRQAYDADLRDFQRKLQTSIKEISTNAAANPGSKTDILGSVGLAEQEFHADGSSRKYILVVLTDFLQDDGAENFGTTVRLRDLERAKIFSQQAAQKDDLSFQGVNIYLGLLRSEEYARLSKTRRTALKIFWMAYFKTLGGKPEFVTDGVGFLENLQSQ